ncbi:MAG TPA: hypothetical protein VKM94_10220 [Blastocatellia bacterium]|nr:hypothetical protein [Blastocatellia bacterium]
MNDKQQDAALILRLYELRRDELLRRARRWYFSEFDPKDAQSIAKLLVSGHDQSAYYRMITSYWDMAASLVNNGGIDEKMFLEANGEHIGTFCKVAPYIEEVRGLLGSQDYLRQLEILVFKTPNAADRLERFRGFFQRWQTAAC